jgi:hypothetical protein
MGAVNIDIGAITASAAKLTNPTVSPGRGASGVANK